MQACGVASALRPPCLGPDRAGHAAVATRCAPRGSSRLSRAVPSATPVPSAALAAPAAASSAALTAIGPAFGWVVTVVGLSGVMLTWMVIGVAKARRAAGVAVRIACFALPRERRRSDAETTLIPHSVLPKVSRRLRRGGHGSGAEVQLCHAHALQHAGAGVGLITGHAALTLSNLCHFRCTSEPPSLTTVPHLFGHASDPRAHAAAGGCRGRPDLAGGEGALLPGVQQRRPPEEA